MRKQISGLDQRAATNAASAGAQFISERAFPARRAKGSTRWTARDIIGELIRLRSGEYLRHFNADSGRSPVEPQFVPGFGFPRTDVLGWLDGFLSDVDRLTVRYAGGTRKQHSGVPILLCVVASYPRKATQTTDLELDRMTVAERRAAHLQMIEANRQLSGSAAFVQWRDATLAWAMQRYAAAERVIACVHVDEANLHLHMVFHNRGRSVKPLMAGPSAAAKAEQANASRKQMQVALKSGLSELGDDYYKAVSAKFGHLRKSEHPKPSLTRSAYVRKKAQDLAAIRIAEAEAEARRLTEAARMEADEIRSHAEEQTRRKVGVALSAANAEIAAIRQAAIARMTAESAEAVRRELDRFQLAKQELMEKEARWRALLDELVPDEKSRAEMMTRFRVRSTR